MMSNTTAPIHADNLLGICHALGETFGVNPLVFRLALITGLLFSAKLTLIAYFTAGVAVLVAHLFTRERPRGGRPESLA
jgi:phage shock protein C